VLPQREQLRLHFVIRQREELLVAGATLVPVVPVVAVVGADVDVPEVDVAEVAEVEVADSGVLVAESVGGGTFGVLVGGATAGTRSVADGGTV
jgi:hypothetical protein